MENTYIIVIVALVLFVFFILSKLSKSSSQTRKVLKNNAYSYTAKDLPMSRTEAEFFTKLEHAVSERYYVFPQVHLSSLLSPQAQSKDWLYAFRHINGKSVDYVLCDKQTLRPTYAIELDDYTHDKADRRKRDAEVERIFYEAELPLVRFRNKNISEAEIIKALMNTFKL
jgi:hypothetical protein